MDRVDTTCRKCCLTFSTAAQTRTTCPGCKGAVTVRRHGATLAGGQDDDELMEGNPLVWIVGLLGVVLVGLVSWWRGRQTSAPPTASTEPPSEE